MILWHHQPRLSISIHSLPKEGDRKQPCGSTEVKQFQSTPSPRRETYIITRHVKSKAISIHSLPKEGDQTEISARCQKAISIHSLPKEGDMLRQRKSFGV